MGDALSSSRFGRWFFGALALAFALALLYALRGPLTPVFVGFLIAYTLDPVIDMLEARRIPRAAGIAVVLTLVIGATVLGLVVVVPTLAKDLTDFATEIPGRTEFVWTRLRPFLRDWGVVVPTSLNEVLHRLEIGVGQVAQAAAPTGAAIGWLLGSTVSVVGAAVGLLMIPIFSAYLLHDFDRIIAGVRDLVPLRYRPMIVAQAQEVDAVLGAFIRGQGIVMLILAVCYSVAYALLGVRLAVVIGILAGVSSFIPYVGGIVALGLALLMCVLEWHGLTQVLSVIAVHTAIQWLEGFVITPKIVGDKVGLQAIWVLLALMVGGELFGFLGVVLALPAAAVAKIFVVRGIRFYRASAWFAKVDVAPKPPHAS